MRIAVTGSRGFVSSWLTPELILYGHHVIGLDREDGDLAEDGVAERLILDVEPDFVIHLAAKYGRLLGEENPEFTVQQNAQVTTSVARVCGQIAIPLVYVSSSEAYGDHGLHTIREDDLYEKLPHNIYGLSKRWGEEACRLYAPDNLLILRLNMPYGPNQPTGYGRCALTTILRNALHSEPSFIHRGAERSWTYVQDTARAVASLIGQTGVYNVGRDDDPRLMLSIAEQAYDLAGTDPWLVREVEAPPMQTIVKRLSVERLRGTGFEPQITLEEGMTRTLAWLRKQSATS